MWDPGLYLRYADERGRPFADLLHRIDAENPTTVVDLGCGPGNLTATLATRWPGARIVGIDSSPEMVARAHSVGGPVTFVAGDLRDWAPTPDVDVVVSNSALQWVPDHADLLDRWVRALRPAAWLGLQVPGNFDSPSHQAIRSLAGSPLWRDRLAAFRDAAGVHEPTAYAARLLDAGCAVDCWETTYLHILPAEGAEHPVLAWLSGTALRPARTALDDEQWQQFTDELRPRLAAAYPIAYGRVLFPYRRIFVVAQTPRDD
jgi:trans-aconitate 2-methyltransferase